ncbi:MAG: hypothetical protein KAS66_08285 [Candidatus Omnitrophica bacterium]|nr:hypothetical protein [Candidatus Omnitrophota bacterium]
MRGNEWEIMRDKKVCYLDVDGVLNSYPESWLLFLRHNWEKIGILPGRITDLNQMKQKIPYQKYQDLKAEYRDSGWKENIPPSDGASALTKQLHGKGYHICIITSRPVRDHPSLYGQTTRWLNKNDILYDDIIFAQDKHIEVLSRYPSLKFGVEDHRYYANLVASYGYKMYLINNKYNQGEIHPLVTRVGTLKTIWRDVEETI